MLELSGAVAIAFAFGVTKISDRNNFKKGRMTRLMVSEGCTWQSCPVHSSRGNAGARGGNNLQRPVTVNIPPQTRLYLLKLSTPLNPALPAGNKPVADISDSIQSIPVTNPLKIRDCLVLRQALSVPLAGPCTVWSRMALSPYVSLPSTGITDVCHYTQPMANSQCKVYSVQFQETL